MTPRLPHRFNTYSLCALDPTTGEAGVVVASRATAVGAVVPYAAPGIGAIAIQGCVDADYGRLGMQLLTEGKSADHILQHLIARDTPKTTVNDAKNSYYQGEGMTIEGDDYTFDPAAQQYTWIGERIRQVGIVDAQGHAVSHSGARLQTQTASRTGAGYACQGNALTGPAVIDAMADTYEQARADGQPMDSAMIAALLAADAQGGDKRGTRAAALLVMRERGHWTGSDRYRDLRIDDADNAPLALAELFAKF